MEIQGSWLSSAESCGELYPPRGTEPKPGCREPSWRMTANSGVPARRSNREFHSLRFRFAPAAAISEERFSELVIAMRVSEKKATHSGSPETVELSRYVFNLPCW